MLFVLSPAKALDYDTPASEKLAHSLPSFVKEPQTLIKLLKQKSPQDIATLMHLSDALARLNVVRYQTWSPKATTSNAKQAVLAFNGDVYDGLNAKTLKPSQLDWAQNHIAILSGLYGVLRPLDLLQAYRLEMGTALATPHGHNLYQFWGSRIAERLNHQLAQDKTPIIINLASQEYFKSVDRKVLRARVIHCAFEDWKNGQYKTISFFAKRARGLMARYAILNKIITPKKLEGFNLDNYAFAAEASQSDQMVFRRKIE